MRVLEGTGEGCREEERANWEWSAADCSAGGRPACSSQAFASPTGAHSFLHKREFTRDHAQVVAGRAAMARVSPPPSTHAPKGNILRNLYGRNLK